MLWITVVAIVLNSAIYFLIELKSVPLVIGQLVYAILLSDRLVGHSSRIQIELALLAALNEYNNCGNPVQQIYLNFYLQSVDL